MYCPRGQIGQIGNSELIEELLQDKKPLVKKYNAYMLKSDSSIKYNEAIRKGFKRAGFLISNKHPKRDKFTSKPYEYFR